MCLDELAATSSIATLSKGSPLEPYRSSLLVAGGGEGGVAHGVGVVPALRLELRALSAFSLYGPQAPDSGSDSATSSLLLAGYGRNFERDGFGARLGLEAGGGAVIQSELHPAAYSATLAAGAFASVSIPLGRRISLGLEATLACGAAPA